jgi:hypothetical protein
MKSRETGVWLAVLIIASLVRGESSGQTAGLAPGAGQPLVQPSPPNVPTVTLPAAVPPPLTEGANVTDAPPPAVPQVAKEVEAGGWLAGLTLDGEYLYLRPSRGAFVDYAILNPGGGNVPNGEVVSRDWGWRSAFRTGLGYRLPDSEWGAGFYYTYLHSADSSAVAAPDGGTLFATLTHPGTVSQVATASDQTSLNYNVFDLEVGRWWHPDPAFAVRGFGGGRFARIDQNVAALYDGGDANQDQVNQRLHFNGGGFRVGLDASWLLGGGFSLFGRANGSLVGGDFHSTLLETNNAGATTLTNFSDHFFKVVPVAELTLGAGWQYHTLRLTAGYTFINWFGLVNVPTFVDDAHQGKFTYGTGDLSLQGLVLRAEWWF